MQLKFFKLPNKHKEVVSVESLSINTQILKNTNESYYVDLE